MEKFLCEICSTIPFQEIHDQGNHYEGPTTFTLGSPTNMKARVSCCFCQLICRVIQDDDNSTYDPAVTVEWVSSLPAFDVNRLLPMRSAVAFVTGEAVRGRLVTSGLIDPALLHRWLDTCTTSHLDTCSRPSSEADGIADVAFSFRLIDVEHLCIVEAASALVDYVALSYVWGQVSTKQLTKNNKQGLMRADGLGGCWHQIPETVRDAIRLVQKLGMRYLWVDTLCIVQDDPEDMAVYLSMMDKVYEMALFTIIAGSGIDANQGLPGVRIGSRKARQDTCEPVSGLQLVVTNECGALLKNEVYNRRGWT
jgi:hypothetical protein